jgi:phosphohistidine phosphatase
VPLVVDVLRHGEAEPAGSGGDDARPLSAAGRRAIAWLGTSLGRERRRYDRIFSSPLLRARQTAEILRDTGRPGAKIERMDELAAEAEPSEVLAALKAHGVSRGRVLLVTHQPLAGRLVMLLTGEAPAFRPGALVSVECGADLAPESGRVARAFPPAPQPTPGGGRE